jgi:1,2-diacylglycerol 3-alpha-glucosyltransferase
MSAAGPLKMVIAASGLGHVARGIETWADDLATTLAERGLSVTLCKGAGTVERSFERVNPCWRRDGADTKWLLRLLPRRLSWRIGMGSPYDIEQLTFAVGLIRFLRRHRADILHVQDPLVALLAQRARRMGLIATRTILAHGTEESLSFLRKIDYLQHLAPWHLEQARKAGIDKDHWTVIPNFIDVEKFAPGHARLLRAELNIPSSGLVVLATAAIKRHHKRVDYLIQEFARLRRAAPNLPAWLVIAGGRENDTDDLVAQGERLLGDRVRFLVRFPRTRMPELYRAADVFCITSLLEMMPIALLEATGSGLPCLVNKQPVMQWMIGPGGHAIDMSATGTLAYSLEQLLRSPDERERLGSKAREHCLQNFSREVIIEQILDYYAAVAGRPATAQAAGESICA